MLSGPILRNVIRFSVPIVLTGMLQLLYNAADMIVVGHFAEPGALAAVGSTGSLINLLVNVFMGISVGTCVVVARALGAQDYASASRATHTSVIVALLAGVLVGILGLFAARPLLIAMDAPADVIDRSVLYVRIYFAGMPVNMLYNFGGAVLRATGDTKKPLVILSVAGIINVVLNLITVIGFKMGVAGVATATVISQAVSAVLVLLVLAKSDGAVKLERKKLRIYRHELWQMLKIGLPAGIQGSVFSISNVLIQSSVNSFGSVVMEGCAASGNLENFVYTAMNSVSQASLTFISQNYGAGNFKRMNRVLGATTLVVTLVGIGMGSFACLCSRQLLGIYTPLPEVVEYGRIKLLIICGPYFLCGIMDTVSGAMRGLGYSTQSLIVSLLGACASRILWIYTVFAAHRELWVLFISYPISWLLTLVVNLTCFFIFKHRLEKRYHAAAALHAAQTLTGGI